MELPHCNSSGTHLGLVTGMPGAPFWPCCLCSAPSCSSAVEIATLWIVSCEALPVAMICHVLITEGVLWQPMISFNAPADR